MRHPSHLRALGDEEKMNREIVKKLLEQLQQDNQAPEKIGKLNIANVMLWMKKPTNQPQ